MIKRIFESDTDGRLDVFIGEVLEVSRSQAKNLIEKGAVTVNNVTASKAGFALKAGDVLTVDIPEPTPIEALPQDIDINIVYEDEHLVVVNKAQGMVVHPAPGSPDRTLVNALLFRIKTLSGINGEIRPGIVHRLDKDTSGLMVVAKTDEAHLSLSSQISAHTAHRTYLGLTDGNWKEEEGEIIAPIGRSPSDRKKMAVVADGKFAKTHFKVEERFGKFTLVRFRLHTGRTHQIRVHCAYRHHPIVGDFVYGGSNPFGLHGQLLHAYRLEFVHPVTREKMEFEAPLPDYYCAVLEKLRMADNSNRE